jgi:endoglucanase
VGFHGTLAWLKDNQNGPRPIVISIEMSNHRSYAEPGAGPVLRVGDRARIFSPEVTRWMQQEMEALSGAGDFQFQRKLMSGGTCEGTPFAMAGYPTGALCLPLENYHNQGPNHAIEPEAVRRSDWEQLVRILVRLAECPFPGPKAGALERRLRDYTKAGTQALRRQPLS